MEEDFSTQWFADAGQCARADRRLRKQRTPPKERPLSRLTQPYGLVLVEWNRRKYGCSFRADGLKLRRIDT